MIFRNFKTYYYMIIFKYRIKKIKSNLFNNNILKYI